VAAPGATIAFEPVGVPRDAFTRSSPNRLDLAFATAASGLVGVDLHVDPKAARVDWELYLDDAPFPAHAVHGGRFGIVAPSLVHGVSDDDARAAAFGRRLPEVDVGRELGLFVTAEGSELRGGVPERVRSAEGGREMERLMKEWGYARASSTLSTTTK
jgi:hypothetical protein